MTTDEARDAAWREYLESELQHPESLRALDGHSCYDAGWSARGQHDKEQIAALDKRALLREWRSGKYALWRDDPAAIAGFSAGVDAALRALGQSEEMKP